MYHQYIVAQIKRTHRSFANEKKKWHNRHVTRTLRHNLRFWDLSKRDSNVTIRKELDVNLSIEERQFEPAHLDSKRKSQEKLG